jgi:uncharacterized protein YbbK (DUF523 family)
MGKSMPKPVVVVSRCLTSAKCRHDGEVLSNDFVNRLEPHVKFQSVCPEMDIGLACPRERIVVIKSGSSTRLYQPATKTDLTLRMVHFAHRFLDGLKRVDGFLLKSKSPSCALRDAKHFATKRMTKSVARGQGMFARSVLKDFEHLPVEDERRLGDAKVREGWLTRLFAVAALRSTIRARSLRALRRFHNAAAGFLKGCNAQAEKRMARLLENSPRRPVRDVLEDYETEYMQLLSSRRATLPRFPGTDAALGDKPAKKSPARKSAPRKTAATGKASRGGRRAKAKKTAKKTPRKKAATKAARKTAAKKKPARKRATARDSSGSRASAKKSSRKTARRKK